MAQVSIILGVASDGEIYFTLNRGYHNQNTMIIFLKKLLKVLDGKDQHWRKKTVIMMDNASYHRSKLVSTYIAEEAIPVMYLGPYQFRTAPVEKAFAFIKRKNLNPNKLKVTTQ
jgi:transposase